MKQLENSHSYYFYFILYLIHITHLVNHQKVILEMKPAVISGQAFWKSNKNTTGTLVCSSDLSMSLPHNPVYGTKSFFSSILYLKAWRLPLALDHTHTTHARTHAAHTHARHHARHSQPHTHTTHTHTHTTRWFLWFTGTLHRRNGFYTVQAVCAIALHYPTPKLIPQETVHFYFPSKKLTLYDL